MRVVGVLLMAMSAAPVAAVTLTERSDAVLSASSALRAAGLLEPALEQVVRRVVEAYRARDARALRESLDHAERFLEPAAALWDPARIDLRAWEIAEGDSMALAVWRRDREVLVLDPEGIDERALYFRLKGDTRVRAIVLTLPIPARTAELVSIPPEGYGGWRYAYERIVRIAELAARPVLVLAGRDSARYDAAAWDLALRRDRIARVGDPADTLPVGIRVIMAPDSWTATRLFVSVARSTGSRHYLVPGQGSAEGPLFELLEQTVALAGDTPRVLSWRQGTAAALYAPGIVLVGNVSTLPLQVDLFTGLPEAEVAVTPLGRALSTRYGHLRVVDGEGRVEQDARILLGARLRFRVPAGGLWSLMEERNSPSGP